MTFDRELRGALLLRVGLTQQLSADGDTRAARTEYDGFFRFEGVAPGRHRVRLDPEQARTLKVRVVEEPVVVATAEGGLVGKVAVTLVRDADAP